MARRFVREFVYQFPLIHPTVGMLGNTTFALGSVLFFFPSLQRPALWLFIVGSFGMLLGSLGEAFVRYERHKRGLGTGSASETDGLPTPIRDVLGTQLTAPPLGGRAG